MVHGFPKCTRVHHATFLAGKLSEPIAFAMGYLLHIALQFLMRWCCLSCIWWVPDPCCVHSMA